MISGDAGSQHTVELFASLFFSFLTRQNATEAVVAALLCKALCTAALCNRGSVVLCCHMRTVLHTGLVSAFFVLNWHCSSGG